MVDKEELDKLLKEFPNVEEKSYRSLNSKNRFGWETESNHSYLKKNKEAALWFLKNYRLIQRIIEDYVPLRQYLNNPEVAKEFPITGTGGCWIRRGENVKRDGKGGWEKC